MNKELESNLKLAATEYWEQRLGMAAPKYCAFGSYEHFEKGFIAGYLLHKEAMAQHMKDMALKMAQDCYEDSENECYD